jgi:hypothetical protein
MPRCAAIARGRRSPRSSIHPCAGASAGSELRVAGRELRRREAARTAILYAFDLIEYDGKDLRNLPFLEAKAAMQPLI